MTSIEPRALPVPVPNSRTEADASTVYAPLEAEVRDGVPRKALQYWNRCRGGRDMPSRSDMQPTDIASLLPYVFLVDVMPGRSRYRYRLVGTMIAEWSGEDATGRSMDDPRCGDGSSKFIALHDEVVHSRTPLLTVNQPALFHGSTLLFDRILLPLADEDGRVSMIIGAADARSADSASAWPDTTAARF